MIECPICYENQETYSMIKCGICNNECCKKCHSKINKCSFCRHSFEEIKNVDPSEHIESNNYTFLASMSCAYRFLLLLYICSLCSPSQDSQDSQD